MKIVDIAGFYTEQGGGVRRYVDEKLRVGSTTGHEIVVIAPGKRGGEMAHLGGRIIWVESPPFPLDTRYHVLWREKMVHDLLRREAPDVIEGSTPWACGWIAARYPGTAVKSLVFHQDPVAVIPQTLLDRLLSARSIDKLFGWYWAYLERLSRRFDATIVGGAWLADRLEQHGIHRPIPVPLGIEKTRFSPALQDATLRHALLARCGLPPEATLLITVSRHHPEKRLCTLIEAVRRVNHVQPVGLVIYGDGPLRPLVQRRARRAGHVHLAGFEQDRDALAAALASADALLHGSAAETYGIAVAEAICSGLPLVVPLGGGAYELAGRRYAEVYPPGDATACAEAIGRLLARDRTDLRHASAAAAGTVASTKLHFAHLFALYQRLCSERCRRAA